MVAPSFSPTAHCLLASGLPSSAFRPPVCGDFKKKKPGLKYAPTFDQGGEQLVPGSESLAWVMRIDQRSMAFYMATCAVHFAPTPATHFVWTFLAVTGLTGVGKIGLRALSPELTEMIRI